MKRVLWGLSVVLCLAVTIILVRSAPVTAERVEPSVSAAFIYPHSRPAFPPIGKH
jgi:hypothetical protein